MKTTQMRTNGVYSEVAVARGSVNIACVRQTPRQAGEWESLRVERGRLQVCSGWRLLPWRSWRSLTRNEASEVIHLGVVSGFRWLIPSGKLGQNEGSCDHGPSYTEIK